MDSFLATADKITSFHLASDSDQIAPLTVWLRDGEMEVILIGTKHTKDLRDPQFEVLNNFQKETLSNISYVLCIEGSVPDTKKTVKELLPRYGEGSELIHGAQVAGVQIVSIEPSFDEVVNWSLELMPDKNIFAQWATLNVVGSLITDTGQIDLKKKDQLQKIFESIGNKYSIQGTPEEIYDVIVSSLWSAGISVLPQGFNKLFSNNLDKEIIQLAQRPGDGPYMTNRAADVMNKARDYGLMKNTISATKENKTVVAWMGLNHVISQLSAYKSLGFTEIK